MCINAMIIRQKQSGDLLQVPCNNCSECVARRISAWSHRLMEQEKVSVTSHFITLTYDTKTVPITPNGFMSLATRDLELFWKKLRKRTGADVQPLRYYAVGEYGGRTKRPHYHALLFNGQLSDVELAWSRDGRPLGSIHAGQVTGASVGYCLKYMHKRKWRPMHKNDDRVPQFARMSKDLASHI